MGLMDEEASSEETWVPYEEAPFNGDVSFLLVPKTREMVKEAETNAKRNKKYHRHNEINKDGEKVSKQGDPQEAFVEELAKLVVKDWKGIVNKRTKEPIPCTDDTKVLLFNNVDVANWIVKAAGELAVVELDGDEKNSVSSFVGTSRQPSGE